MTIKEMSSKLAFRKVGSASINADQAFTALGSVIDTLNFDFDCTFVFGITAHTTGTYNFRLQMADDAGFTQNVEVVDREHLVGQPTGGIKTLSAAQAAGTDNYEKLGLFANRRYVRLQVDAASVVTTGATIEAFVALGAQIVPT